MEEQAIYTKTSVDIKEASKHLIIADISIEGALFTLALSCYYDGGAIFGRNWCVYSPNWKFGCKLSDDNVYYNLEQLPRRADGATIPMRIRRLLAQIITDILKTHGSNTNLAEQLEDITQKTISKRCS